MLFCVIWDGQQCNCALFYTFVFMCAGKIYSFLNLRGMFEAMARSKLLEGPMDRRQIGAGALNIAMSLTAIFAEG